ncbi:MAG: DUF4124 domain-containing protein [Rhodocyclaceae bacterium]|nr:DUF4124 domain-containing protein [Rhodocyclaceae bacterium]
MTSRRSTISRIALLMGLFLPALAPAAVYKCVENGRLVYSDRKCSAESAPIDSAPALDNQRRGSDETVHPGRPARREAPTGRRRPAGATVIDSADPTKKALCDEVRRRKAVAERNGGSYRGDSLKELEALEFSRCYGHVNGAH